MRWFFFLLALLLVLPSVASAATYYVSQNGNEACTGDYSISQFNSGTSPFNDLKGDTVEFCGTISTRIVPTHSGTSGAPIKLTNHDSSFVSNGGVSLSGRNWVYVIGKSSSNKFRIENTGGSPWISLAGGSDHNIIQYCYFYRADRWEGLQTDADSDYNKILDNTFADAPITGVGHGTSPSDLLSVRGDYNLIQGNKFGKCAHSAVGHGTTATHNIIRNNIIDNRYHNNLDLYEPDADYNLIEGNIIKNAGENGGDCTGCNSEFNSRFANKGMGIGGSYNIIRNNVFWKNGYASPVAELKSENNRFYQNTFYKNVRNIQCNNANYAVNGNVFKNNIIDSANANGGSQSVVGEIWWYVEPGSSSNTFAYNQIDVDAGDVRYEGATYSTISSLNAISDFSNNIDSPPGMVNPDNGDFSLQSNSPMIDAGMWLTTITSSSDSGTSFQVADSRYFMDGYGIVQGDLVQLQGQTQTERITNVDYSTNTITVGSSLSWTQGQGVSLPYSGSKPDIGAFEYGSPQSCETDQDSDGYGTGPSCLGSDCDDSDPGVHQEIPCPWDGASCGNHSLCILTCPIPPAESCNNSIDDDCDGQSDCQDSGCYSDPACQGGTSSYTALRAHSPPTIDGDLSEFADANPITLTNSRGNTATYSLLWDDTALYISAQAQDSQLSYASTQRDGPLWDDDSIELFFDTLNDGGSSLNSNDYKFFTNIFNAQHDYSNGNGGTSWNTIFASAVTTDGTPNSPGDSDTGYTIEMAIPWADWVTPSSSDVWGFDVSMNDRDDAGTREYTAWWNSDGGILNDPDGWGDLMFSAESVIPPHRADTSGDGCVDDPELMAFISHFYLDSTSYPIGELMEAVGLWKAGTGC